MRKIREVIVVEGRYDKNTLSQIVDATVVTLGALPCSTTGRRWPFSGSWRRSGAHRPDGQRRGGLRHPQLSEGGAARDKVKQAYIPDIRGKEKRKRTPGKEGKLGVEGMKPDVILEALRRAGVTFLDEETAPQAEKRPSPRQTSWNGDWPGERAAASGGRRCCGGWICRST